MGKQWDEAIGQYLAFLLLVPVAASTVYTRRQQLQRAGRSLRVCDPWAVSSAELVGWWGAQDWATDTRRAHRAALRGFYAWGLSSGRISSSPAAALPRVSPSPPRPRPAPDSVYLPALSSADPRERLMMLLAADHGLRRAEIAVVHSRDLIEDLDGWTLLVHGKGGKERHVPLTARTAALLRASPGYAFPGDVDGHLSPRWVGTLVNRLLPSGWTIHKLRHRAGTKWWEVSGGDLASVQDLLGHADPKTTRVYVATDRAKLRRIVNAAA